jgi:hypothetical protein
LNSTCKVRIVQDPNQAHIPWWVRWPVGIYLFSVKAEFSIEDKNIIGKKKNIHLLRNFTF